MLSQRMYEARVIAGLTQLALSEALTDAGYPTTEEVILRYEMGQTIPTARILIELASILNVDSSYFLHASADFSLEKPVIEPRNFPRPTELLNMPLAEREYWINCSFNLATNEDFEIFEAFGEEDF